ncbi:MAG: DHH family phosphoesterase [Candidatus Pacearchaeota archaeon]|jgi:RecJ-like exonuclease
MKRGELDLRIKECAKNFLEISKNKPIEIVSHFDTDGITSAAIIIQALKKIDRKFSLRILKSLTKETIKSLPKEKIILFLDLGSGSINLIKKTEIKDIFILDHHEISEQELENIHMVNPQLFEKQRISSSGIAYLFCKELNETNKELAKLAILGMIGDSLEKNIDELNHGILQDGEIIQKKGILIYPSTRPLNRTLELCSDPFIPGVTGDSEGVRELLRQSGIKPENGKYKNLIDLNEDEMEKLTTNILLRNPKIKNKDLIGNIYLLKFFGKLEDAREMSAKINACSRFGESNVALMLCLENQDAKKKAEAIHAKYKQMLISGIKKVNELNKIEGKGFAIINADKEIKDTMIGTITSILSYSSNYEEETIIIGLAKYDDKIKVSARTVGNKGRNTRQILEDVVKITGGEVGGHEFASGCIIPQEKEKEFLELLKKNLELQVIKIVNP